MDYHTAMVISGWIIINKMAVVNIPNEGINKMAVVNIPKAKDVQEVEHKYKMPGQFKTHLHLGVTYGTSNG